jgi:hypothetical protein
MQRLCEVAQRGVPPRVAALERPLELDEEVVAAEGMREPRRRVRVADGEPVARTAGKADEPVVQLFEQALVEARGKRLAPFLRSRLRMRSCQEPAEVRVAPRRLDEQRHVRSPVK